MLKDKCINFERSMNEMCMTMNHNADVTGNYLYLTYGGTLHGESNDFRHIFPSKQLSKLELEELEDKDYVDIINNFIKNVKENVMIINHNTELLRTWLGEKISEELEEIFDILMEKVKREIIPINCNIEMLIERF